MRVALNVDLCSRPALFVLGRVDSHERDDISNRSVACILGGSLHEDKGESLLVVSASWTSPMQEAGQWKERLT